MTIEVVDIVILGRNYKVSCPKGQEDALYAAAGEVNDRLVSLRSSTKTSTNEQLAVLAALNFCHELCLEREKNALFGEAMDLRIKSLQHTIEVALNTADMYENRLGKRLATDIEPSAGSEAI
ncbi:MAG: cell division protein ZapA [Aeromonas sp.]